jgi:AcrR family transcriptional regulator
VDEDRYTRLLALLWSDEPGRATRGPRRSLTVARVVDEAVMLADRDGSTAFPLARLAEELGIGTMSLYSYVDTKDDLVALMVDAAHGPLPPLPDRAWRPAITAWAHALRRAYAGHVWLVPLLSRPRVMGPCEAAWAEAALRAVRSLDLQSTEVTGLLLGVAALARTAAVAGPGSQAPGSAFLTTAGLHRFDPADAHPHLRALIGQLWPEPPGDPFEVGLGLLLDGVAVQANLPDRPGP